MRRHNRLPRDVDEIAVERATRGDLAVHLNRAEMHAAFRLMLARGYSNSRIACTLGVTKRTVERWRSGAIYPNSRYVSERAS